MKTVLILGSERKHGNTWEVAQALSQEIDIEIIDLLDYKINRFSYTNDYPHDDNFMPLIKEIVEKYDHMIFATPVYWYSMSGLMKIFFDRITDLLSFEKELGRKLRGKSMSAISSSNGNSLEEHFWLPFKYTAEYLGMDYLGNIHTFEKDDNSASIKAFAKILKEAK